MSTKILSFLRPYRWWVIMAPLFMAVEVFMDLSIPRLVQIIVDEAIAHSNRPLVVSTGTKMLGATVIGIFGGLGCGITAIRAAQCFGADLREAVYRKIQSFSFGNLDEQESGSLITRVTNDVNQLQDIVQMVLRGMVRAPLLLVGSVVMAVLTSPKLAVLFIPLIPLVLGFLVWIVRRTYPIYGEVQSRLDDVNTRLQENLAGVRVVKALVRARFEEQRFSQANDRLMTGNILAGRLGALTGPFMTITLNVGVVAALWIGGVFTSRGEMSVGQIIAFITYLTQTLMALMFVSMMVTQISRAAASAERVDAVFAVEPKVVPPESPRALNANKTAGGKLQFERVSFAYGDGEEVLQDISFTAEPGQTIAILGGTGSGKSSLVNLIPRFYDPTKGRITLDGVDLRAVANDNLRARISISLQEAILFSGTIAENIRYGRPNATDDEVQSAAKVAQADEFIQRLAGGYDEVVGQRGVNLSGGQKQRLGIARAVLAEPEILILDDSTSAVDLRTEARIQAAFNEQMHDQTRIIVAQRIRSVLAADKILLLEDGRLVAQGNHEQLMATSPVYREIYDSQMSSGSEDAHATR